MSCVTGRLQRVASIALLTRPSRPAFATARLYSKEAASINNESTIEATPSTTAIKRTGLRGLPTSVLFRSLAVLSVASLPQPALSLLLRAVKRHSHWVDSIPLLRGIARRTFYNHFCIGETKSEIERHVDELRRTGVRGVILSFAREAADSSKSSASAQLTAEDTELQSWVHSNLETIDKLNQGDYLGVRCTGAGRATLRCMDDVFERSKAFGLEEALRRGSTEVNVFKDALTKICAAAQSHGIRVLIDAEDTRRQLTIDHVALVGSMTAVSSLLGLTVFQSIMPIFNKGGHAVVLNTYQMSASSPFPTPQRVIMEFTLLTNGIRYLKAGVSKLVTHLRHSTENNYVLGVKMVRGAYIHSEPDRDLLHDTKADTDTEYDQAVRLLVGSNGASLADEKGAGATWSADLMLATHNTHSAREALRLYRERFLTRGIGPAAHGAGLRSLAFAQLKGMADELSFKLTEEIESMSAEASGTALEAEPDVARRLPGIGVYKYSIWGTFQECLLYMLRRAEENKDAAARSRTTALAIVREMGRRVLPFTRS